MKQLNKTKSKFTPVNTIIVSCISILFSAQLNAEDMSVSISGPSETKVGCGATFQATPSGGKSPYTYSWYPGFGEVNSSVTKTTNFSGSFYVRVTVKDSDGCTVQKTHDLTVHEEYETNGQTNTSDGTLAVNGSAGGFVSSSVSHPSDASGNVTLNISTSSTSSHLFGFNLSGAGDVAIIKAQVGGSYSYTRSSTKGVTVSITAAPGETKAIWAAPWIKTRSGEWKKYDCSGISDQGNWLNSEENTSEPKWDYSPRTPS